MLGCHLALLLILKQTNRHTYIHTFLNKAKFSLLMTGKVGFRVQ